MKRERVGAKQAAGARAGWRLRNVALTLIFSSGPGADVFDFLGMIRILRPASSGWGSSASCSLRLLPLLRTSIAPRPPEVGLVDGLPG